MGSEPESASSHFQTHSIDNLLICVTLRAPFEAGLLTLRLYWRHSLSWSLFLVQYCKNPVHYCIGKEGFKICITAKKWQLNRSSLAYYLYYGVHEMLYTSFKLSVFLALKIRKYLLGRSETAMSSYDVKIMVSVILLYIQRHVLSRLLNRCVPIPRGHFDMGPSSSLLVLLPEKG